MAVASVLARGAQPAQDTASVAPAPASWAPPATLSVDVENILATLTPRERRVLQLRFGFVDFRERTVEEVGRRMGVPSERIASIEKEALAKFGELVAGR
jgi:RNA polymerase primary sigma factor